MTTQERGIAIGITDQKTQADVWLAQVRIGMIQLAEGSVPLTGHQRARLEVILAEGTELILHESV